MVKMIRIAPRIQTKNICFFFDTSCSIEDIFAKIGCFRRKYLAHEMGFNIRCVNPGVS